MTVSPERIEANKRNAQKSSGPKTAEGKEASRANSYKHGLTGAGIVMAEKEAAEIEDKARRMRAEMKPVSEAGADLIDRMAMLSVRLVRCALDERVRLSELNDGEGGLLDLSKEGQLAHRYEQAAQRNYSRSYDDFRRVEAEAKANGITATLPLPKVSAPMASFDFPVYGDDEMNSELDDILESLPDAVPTKTPSQPVFTPGLIPISAARRSRPGGLRDGVNIR